MLDEYGMPTSKAKIYKLTSAGEIPHRKYGNKLVFSRKELQEWMNEQMKLPEGKKFNSEKHKDATKYYIKGLLNGLKKSENKKDLHRRMFGSTLT